MVEASLKPGANVDAVGRALGVRASDIYQWRKRQRKQAQRRRPTVLLPVEVAEDIRPLVDAKQRGLRAIIEARGTRVTLDGSVDTELIRSLLECLAQ